MGKLQVIGRAKRRLSANDLLNHGVCLFGVIILIYFGYHAFASERNLISLIRISSEISAKEEELEKIKAERIKLENKTHLLYADSLDSDMLDEQARKQLSYIGKNEVVIFVDKR